MNNGECKELKKKGKELWSIYVDINSQMSKLKKEIQSLNSFMNGYGGEE